MPRLLVFLLWIFKISIFDILTLTDRLGMFFSINISRVMSPFLKQLAEMNWKTCSETRQLHMLRRHNKIVQSQGFTLQRMLWASATHFLNLESWILNPERLDSKSFFWILNLESWIRRGWIPEVFSESWILNLESGEAGVKLPGTNKKIRAMAGTQVYPLMSLTVCASSAMDL